MLTKFLINEYISLFQSKETRNAYRRVLENSMNILPLQIKSIDVTNYISSLNEKYSANTINRIITVLKSYFQYLIKTNRLNNNPAEHLKLYNLDNVASYEALTDEEVTWILDACNTKAVNLVGKMHSAIMHLLIFTGIRRNELCKLCIDSVVKLDNSLVIQVRGKGNRNRTIPLIQIAQVVLEDYISFAVQTGQMKKEGLLFFSSHRDNSRKLHDNSIFNIVKKYVKLAGINKKISPHNFRATCISNALENGATLLQAQQLGGWSSFDMILRYDKRRQLLKNSAVHFLNYKGIQK